MPHSLNHRKDHALPLTKRTFDMVVALILSVLLAPVILVVASLILIRDGRPVLYMSERMKSADCGFNLIKFRTMSVSDEDQGVTGGDKRTRITAIGQVLRRCRLDEVPQLWNVLRGDMSFVGPRPPLRRYVEMYPAIYSDVLRCRPGITGLASIYFHAHEDHLLSRTASAAETEAVYCRACIPRKARLDLLYQAHRNLCFDMALMLKTVFKRLR